MAIIVAGAQAGYRKRVVERSERFDLLTDIPSPELVPLAFREIPLQQFHSRPGDWVRLLTKSGAPAAVACFGNEILRQADEWSVRELLLRQDTLSYLPVHLAVLPELELDFIALQPRIAHGSRVREYFSEDVRVYAEAAPEGEFQNALRSDNSWWARHALALYDEHHHPGAGIRALQRMWQKEEMSLLQKALVLRNLAVAQLRGREYEKADCLLQPAVEAFPNYGEFLYLAALSLILQKRGSKAVPLLERAATKGVGAWPGSGGETWYRSRWLLGTLCAELGRDELALGNLLPSLIAKPAFGPGVNALFKLDLPPREAERLYCPLQQLRIREPQYSSRVDEFLQRHGLGQQASHFRQLPAKPAIEFVGPFFDSSSLARVGRELGSQLIRLGQDNLRLLPTSFATRKPETFPDGEMLRAHVNSPASAPALTIRQSWPPNFRPVRYGRLATIVHWEYQAVPLAWVEAANRHVDEVWVPSEFTRDAFQRAGMAAEKLHLVPLGFSPELLTPQARPWLPEGVRGFVFLFVGGLIKRKGIDLLLDAYREAFGRDDDVTLLLKAGGADSFYAHNSLLPHAQKLARDSRSARIVLLNEDLTDQQLAGLYRGANALVQPYRAEGFGLPLLEAMACGTPVITTAAGPAPEFCPREASILLPAREEEIPDDPPPLGKLSGPLTWFEPDLHALVQALRQAYENPAALNEMGSHASAYVHQRHSWEQRAPLLAARVGSCLQASPNGKLNWMGA